MEEDSYVYYQSDGIDEMLCHDCHETGYAPLDGGQCDRRNDIRVIDRYCF